MLSGVRARLWCFKILAIFCGILTALGALFLVDQIFGYVFRVDTKVASVGAAEGEYVDPHLGHVPLANLPQHQVETQDGEQLFDVWYHFDSYRRRIHPDMPGKKQNYVLFFGDSNVFGEGLFDGQTIPAVFAGLHPEARVYNYAYRGYGTQHVLAKLESGFAPGELTETHGVGLYIYFGYHVARVNGFLSVMAWAGGRQPYYFLDKLGQLRHQGTFVDGRRFWTYFYWLLAHSALLRYWQIDLPQRNARHDQLVCEIIQAAQKRFEAMHSENKFYVVVPPQENDANTFINNCLLAKQIRYINLNEEFWENSKFLIPKNRHFNSLGASYIARAISTALARKLTTNTR